MPMEKCHGENISFLRDDDLLILAALLRIFFNASSLKQQMEIKHAISL